MSYITERQARVPLITVPDVQQVVYEVGPNELVSKIVVEVSRPTNVTLSIESQYLPAVIIDSEPVMPSTPLWIQRSYIGTLTEAILFITTSDPCDCFITVIIEKLH